MGSLDFQTYERTLKRIFWSQLLDEQVRQSNSREMRASLVVNPYTGLAVQSEVAPSGNGPVAHPS